MRRMSGFTLIELLVTITLVGILVSVAVPSFKTTIQNGRLATNSNDLLGALIFARSEAVALNTQVVICASTDGTTCSSGGDWAGGWLIGTGTPASINLPVLRVHAAFTGNNSLTNDKNAKNLRFAGGTGIPVADVPINFSLCDSRHESYGRSIYVSAVGEARVSPTAGKQIDSTTDLTC